LVEIAVAIGISAVTLTTSAVFSTRLLMRAQENFMQDSAVQVSNVIVEQLRLAEVDMQASKTKYVETAGATIIVPKVFDYGTNPRQNWTDFCTASGTSKANLGIDLPKVVGNPSSFDYKITFVSDTTNASFENQNYTITDIADAQKLTGAFYTSSGNKKTNLGVGIQRKVDSSNLITGAVINLNIVLRYYLFNITTAQYTKFTRPTTVKLIKDTVCI
jgi:hypothetical protein